MSLNFDYRDKIRLKIKGQLTIHALFLMAFPMAQNSWSETLWSACLSQSDRVITDTARTCNLSGNPKISSPLESFDTLVAPQPEIKTISLAEGGEIQTQTL